MMIQHSIYRLNMKLFDIKINMLTWKTAVEVIFSPRTIFQELLLSAQESYYFLPS